MKSFRMYFFHFRNKYVIVSKVDYEETLEKRL